MAHPAFGNLFVETERDEGRDALLATRRQRSPSDPAVWACHVMAIEEGEVGPLEVETSRGAFLGRGRTLEAPLALERRTPLAGTTGAVLDPVFCLRRVLEIPAHGRVRVAVTTALASSRDAAIELARDVPRRAHRRAHHLRAGMDGHPRRAPAPRHRGGPGPALPAPGVGDRVPAPRAARAGGDPPAATRRARRPSGGTVSRATCPSCSSASTTPNRGICCARCCWPTSCGGSRGSPSTWSSSTRSPPATSSPCRTRPGRSSGRAPRTRRSTSPEACSCAGSIPSRRRIACCCKLPRPWCCSPRAARWRARCGARPRARRSRSSGSARARRPPRTPRRRPRRTRRRACPSSCSGTGSAASGRTGAST